MYTFGVDRLNEEGVPRDQLLAALKRPDLVEFARKHDRCMVCGRKRVNEAGVCPGCYATLGDAELKIAERWLAGAMP